MSFADLIKLRLNRESFMLSIKRCYIGLALLLVGSLLLAACGGLSATPEPSGAAQQTTSAGADSECPQPNPKMEVTSKELNLFVWTEYIPQQTIDCFEKVYGVKVNHTEYSSNEEMYTKLLKGGANYDIVQPTDYIVEPMIRNKLLQELDKSKLSVAANMDPNYMNLPFDPGNKYTLPYQAGTDSLVVNTDTIKDPPMAYADLWKPDYAGKLVMLDDSRAIIGATLLTLGYDVNTKDPAQIAEATKKLGELVAGVKIFDSDSPKTALIAGDADLGIVWTGEVELAHRENPAIQFVYPAEGTLLWQDNYAIPAGAPHLDAAYAWLNYTLQGDVFWKMLDEFPYTNPNKAALDFAKTAHPELYDGYMKSNITNTPADVIAKGHRIQDVGEALKLYDQAWTEVKGK
jgi:spermidine/putrescine-binding protein